MLSISTLRVGYKRYQSVRADFALRPATSTLRAEYLFGEAEITWTLELSCVTQSTRMFALFKRQLRGDGLGVHVGWTFYLCSEKLVQELRSSFHFRVDKYQSRTSVRESPDLHTIKHFMTTRENTLRSRIQPVWISQIRFDDTTRVVVGREVT